MYGILSKVWEVKRSCLEGNYHMGTLFMQVGISVEKLEKSMVTTQAPLWLQQPPVWKESRPRDYIPGIVFYLLCSSWEARNRRVLQVIILLERHWKAFYS